jgi:predicted Zn-dependent peptidase
MISQTTLSNGMRVVLDEIPHAESAAIGVWIRAGAVDEFQPETLSKRDAEQKINAGISHFLEHMMFKGTEKRSYKDIADDIDRIGASANAFTGKEATCYYIKLLPHHFPVAVDILSDMILHSRFDAEEMEKEKQVIYEEMKMIEDVPEDCGNELIDEAVFTGGHYGHSVIGSPESVGAVTRADIVNYRDQRYTPGNMLISVAGKFDREQVLGILEASFGQMKASGFEQRVLLTAPHEPKRLEREKGIAQSHLFFGKRSVGRLNDDSYPYQLFAGILGGSMSSRLFQNVREEKGLAYSVYANHAAFSQDGMFLIYAGVAHENEQAATQAICVELEKLASEGVGEEELSKVKEQSKGSYLFARESIVGRMSSVGRNLLLLDRIVSPEEVMEKINRVTTEDIRRIARENADMMLFSSVIVH